MQELCSSVIMGLGESGRAEEAFKLYNQLKSNRQTLSKALHEKILNILVSGRMLKDAYTVMKVAAGTFSMKFSVIDYEECDPKTIFIALDRIMLSPSRNHA
jgi:pentatricopeptide repeat protein